MRISFRIYERWRRATSRFRGFDFDGHRYRYLVDPYNTTWLTERAVEVPIVEREVRDAEARNARILEVGNVLAYYGDFNHVVVDKYESAPGVINEDIVDYSPGNKFDLVVAISTVEHVGWDEQPRSPEKLTDALENMRSLVAPGGRLVVTMPAGYNDYLDARLRDDDLGFDWLGAVRRRHRWSLRWRSIAVGQMTFRPWRSIGGANEIVVGMNRF
ncbi:MAG: hypothetical protein HY827_00285 [Actinobacteria bacterium]|nr:hypothetical protein [Actinomycetota bacterium]